MKLKNFFIVSLPIGNYQDISLRALDVLRESEAIIVEDYRANQKNFDLLKIPLENKKIILLNQKNQGKVESQIVEEIIFNYETVSLVSDHGTPVFADPGFLLISALRQYQVPYTHIPGANSVISALVLSGLPIDRYYYVGFLSQKSRERYQEIQQLKNYPTTIVLLETPYRLNVLLRELVKHFPSSTPAVIAFDLTGKEENIVRGSLQQLDKQYHQEKNKLPFVLLINNATHPKVRTKSHSPRYSGDKPNRKYKT